MRGGQLLLLFLVLSYNALSDGKVLGIYDKLQAESKSTGATF